MNKRDPFVLVGLGLVGVTAIGASFTTLMGLAAWVGWHGWQMQILLPICVDVLAIVSGRVWLSNSMIPEARRFARGVSFAAIGISILGNAVGHIVTMHDASTVKIGLAIVVGSLPPAALAAVGHLATLATMPAVEEIVAESIEPAQIVVEPEPTPEPPATEPDPTPETRGRKPFKEPAARKYWDEQRALGHTPVPAELAKVAGADQTMGYRWIKKWAAEDEAAAKKTHTNPASLTLVNA